MERRIINPWKWQDNFGIRPGQRNQRCATAANMLGTNLAGCRG